MKLENDGEHEVALGWVTSAIFGGYGGEDSDIAMAIASDANGLPAFTSMVVEAIEAYELKRWPLPEPSTEDIKAYEADVGRPYEGPSVRRKK